MTAQAQKPGYLLIILLKAAILCCCILSCLFWPCTLAAAAAKSEPLKASVSVNEITDRLETFGIKSVIHVTGAKSTIYVDSVRMGSKAFYQGVEAGDVVRGLAQKNDNTFILSIERKGVPYQIVLSGFADKHNQEQTTKTLTGGAPDTKLDGGGDKNNQPEPREKILARYEIELLIDISGSMNQVDGTDGLSKFEWCRVQVDGLASKLKPYRKTFAVTTFNNSHTTEEGCTPEQVENIFASVHPGGSTDLLDPLEAALRRGENRTVGGGKKAMIVIITDGLPNVPADPREVNRMIVRYTQHLTNPDQILIVLLQIGSTFDGQSFCKELDEKLVSEGAKYDIVDTQTFEELRETGLTNALINSVVEERLARLHKRDVRPFTDLTSDEDLQKLKNERAQIEKDLMGK